jgi:phosphoglycolate phosphatase-like HAD superfamily hydrolase
MTPFELFEKRKDYLICVDSDGCAMDTMDIKHKRSFGPCMVEEWQLGKWKEEILIRWNQINLYSMTRGINRFKGLAMALKEINDRFIEIDGIDDLVNWTGETPELSNRAVEEAYNQTGKIIFGKALAWSKSVNTSINALTDEDKKPFEGVAAGLKVVHTYGDVAVVSSANRDAVEQEWERCGLLEHVDILLCQDAGSKAHCIKELRKKGYAPNHIIMVGDAPGDLDAAKKNGIYFYPILVRKEEKSWSSIHVAIESLIKGEYDNISEKLEQSFIENLKEKK